MGLLVSGCWDLLSLLGIPPKLEKIASQGQVFETWELRLMQTDLSGAGTILLP